MIHILNSNFHELKNDKLRKRTHNKLIGKIKLRIFNNLNRVDKRKSNCETKKEVLNYSKLGLSESVLPVNNSESPVPDENFWEN